MGGPTDEIGNSIAVDSSGNVYTTGYFKGTIDFDPGPGTSNLPSAGAEDIFILKLGPDPLGVTENSFGIPITVYPNPTTGELNIDLGKNYDELIVTIRNLIGQEVLNRPYSSINKIQLEIPGEAGWYLLEIKSDDKKTILKVAKKYGRI